MTFLDCLKQTKGSVIKSRSVYTRSKGWRGDEWYEAWEKGLADEVVSSLHELERHNAGRPR